MIQSSWGLNWPSRRYKVLYHLYLFINICVRLLAQKVYSGFFLILTKMANLSCLLWCLNFFLSQFNNCKDKSFTFPQVQHAKNCSFFRFFKIDVDAKQLTIGFNGVSTANKVGLMYSRKRISQNLFPNFIYIFPKSFMIFYQELLDSKRNYENKIWT